MLRRMKSHLACLIGIAALSGCSSLGIGVSIPIGGPFGVGVGVGSDGRVGGSVGVGVGGVGVGVGGSTQLPKRDPAASAPP